MVVADLSVFSPIIATVHWLINTNISFVQSCLSLLLVIDRNFLKVYYLAENQLCGPFGHWDGYWGEKSIPIFSKAPKQSCLALRYNGWFLVVFKRVSSPVLLVVSRLLFAFDYLNMMRLLYGSPQWCLFVTILPKVPCAKLYQKLPKYPKKLLDKYFYFPKAS